MRKRYKITREFQEDAKVEKTISLEECKQYFAMQPDFTYTSLYTVQGKGEGAATMSIEGEFFMWQHDDQQIPFRYFDGDLYVSGVNDAVIPRMLEVASALHADIREG